LLGKAALEINCSSRSCIFLCCFFLPLRALLSAFKCPWRCPAQPLIVTAVTDFPKAIDLIKVVEASAQRAAEMKLKRQPCQHCSAPQQPVACFCDGCQILMCAQCEKSVHAAPSCSSHERMGLQQKARQQLAAEQEERFYERDAPGLKEELVAKKKHLEERTAKLKQSIAALSSSQFPRAHRHSRRFGRARWCHSHCSCKCTRLTTWSSSFFAEIVCRSTSTFDGGPGVAGPGAQGCPASRDPIRAAAAGEQSSQQCPRLGIHMRLTAVAA
jgi:hypothetical protein